MTVELLRWWDLESDVREVAVALVAAPTVERAIELLADYLYDAAAPDDPLPHGWHSTADELEPGVVQDSHCPAPPGAEGVYFCWFTNR